ncbi:MAG: hypothetical protein WB797_00170 [Nocardioides sp.]
MADRTDDKTDAPATDRKKPRTAQVGATVTAVRARAAQVIWLVCVVAALFLAAGALCVSLKANGDNSLVKFLEQTADKLDLGVFSRGKNGVAHFKGHTQAALTKNALVNWGLAAVVWLVGGRIAEHVVRP